MQYGHFDDVLREYVIDTPQTPLPWINYLGCEDFFTLLSNTAGGYCFFRDARLRRITRYRYNNSPLDSDGFHLYVKDGSSIWNPGWQPVQTDLDFYRCRHGLGYTVIEGKKGGIKVSQTFLVPRGETCLLCKIRIANDSDILHDLDLFPYIEFCLWDAQDDATNFQRNYSTGEVEVETNSIYHKTEYRERRNHYSFLWSSRVPRAVDTSRDAFIGVYGSPARPAAVLNGACSGSIAHGWAPVGAMQIHLSLKPGETDEFLLGLGYAENPQEKKFSEPGILNKESAHRLMEKFSSTASFENAMADLKQYWKNLLDGFKLSAPDKKLCRMVNIWNQYQCMVTFNMSRSASYFESGMGRGMGFRDSCQDLLGFVHMIPERARERILDIAATQFPDGSAYHQYQPLTKKGNLAVGSGFNDDPLWLIAGTDAYLNETGDLSILDEMVPFDNNPDLAQPLLEHLRRSFAYTRTHLGPHGLPLIGRADWNDCLNLNCFSEQPGESFQTTGPNEGPVAESVFIGGMFVKYGTAWVELLEDLGRFEEASEAHKAVLEMEHAVLTAGWDGNWFRRAYDAFGVPVGSNQCEEGQIFIEPQGMCVMAGIGTKTGEAAEALRSVKKHLDTEWGIVLLQPAYSRYYLNLGEISSYPPGYKENAGIFCHNNPWIVCAETVLGHGDRAFEVYRRTAPAYLEDKSEIRRTEPYVYCQMVAGKDAPTFGEGKNSWLTGTSAWTFLSISQAILGIHPTRQGLLIRPCIPHSWKEYRIERRFRGACYRITVENPDGVQYGVRNIYLNGNPVPDAPLPIAKPGTVQEVRVVLG